jgi:hypothetical protein
VAFTMSVHARDVPVSHWAPARLLRLLRPPATPPSQPRRSFALMFTDVVGQDYAGAVSVGPVGVFAGTTLHIVGVPGGR